MHQQSEEPENQPLLPPRRSRNSFLEQSVPPTYFEATNVTYTIKGKTIVNCASLSSCSGEITGILGPSGAGKTSLLNCLTLSDEVAGEVKGLVTINDELVTADLISKYCFIVSQKDFHWPSLTCKEIIQEAIVFYSNLNEKNYKEVRTPDQILEEILETLGLESCKDTKVGNEFIQGLSGGQKRRLSVAVGLVKKPQIIFMDEPTTGLDSAAAAALMEKFRKIADEIKTCIVLTIHQPSTSVFLKMDKALFLANGQTAYFGAPKDLPAYLDEIGYKLEEHTNPADVFIDVINTDFVGEKAFKVVMDKWENNTKLIEPDIKPAESLDNYPRAQKIPLHSQTKQLFLRLFKILRRDPILFFGRVLSASVLNTIVGFTYFNAHKKEQKQVVNRMMATWISFALPCLFNIIQVFITALNTQSIRREVKNGMYSVKAYFVQDTIYTIFYCIIVSFAANGLQGFVIVHHYGPHWLQYFFFMALTYWAFETFAMLCGTCFSKKVLVGIIMYLGYWSMNMMFSGIFLKRDEFFWPIRSFCYAGIIKWGFELMTTICFEDDTYPECTGGPPGCYGHKGKEIIKSLSEFYGSFNLDDGVKTNDCCALFGIGFASWVLYIYFFNKGTKKVAQIQVLKFDDEKKRKSAKIYKI